MNKIRNNTKIMMGLVISLALLLSGVSGNFHVFNLRVKAESLNPDNQKSQEATTETNPATQSALLSNLEKIAAEEGKGNEDIKAIYEQMESKKTGFIAQVLSIKDKTVKVSDPQDGEKFLTFDKSTILVSGNSQENADSADLAKWLEVDDWLVIIGVIEDETFLPRRILISSTDLTPKAKYIKLGTFKSLSSNTLTFIPKGSETEEKLTVGRNTDYQDSTGEDIKTKEFTDGAEVLVVGVTPSSGKTAVNTLRLL